MIFKDRFTEEQLKKAGLNVRQIEVILYTKKYGEITNSKYQEIADVSKATATRDIKELENKGLLKNIGTKGSSAIYKLGVGSVGSQCNAIKLRFCDWNSFHRKRVFFAFGCRWSMFGA